MNNEVHQVQVTIKKMLKSSNIQYNQLAKSLKMSHASVKRILNAKDMTLSKLSQISEALGVTLFEVIEQSKSQNEKKYKFNLNQEKLLARDFTNFLVFRKLLLKEEFNSIINSLQLSKSEYMRIILNLEKVNLIEVHVNNKIKVIANFPFEWIDNGPLEKAYTEKIATKMSNLTKQYGVNNKKNEKQSHIKIKVFEILLQEKEYSKMHEDLQDVLQKYEVISKLRLKDNIDSQVFSFSSIFGRFSWWD